MVYKICRGNRFQTIYVNFSNETENHFDTVTQLRKKNVCLAYCDFNLFLVIIRLINEDSRTLKTHGAFSN